MTVYSSFPSPVPPNVDSLGYQDAATAEFGDAVTLAGTARALSSMTILLSSWALQSDYPGVGTSVGYTVPLTLSFYNFGSSGPNPTAGTLITAETIQAVLPWRPAATPGTCTGGDYQAGDGYCYSGVTAPVTFNFTNVTLPTNVIFGLKFDTQDYGATPINGPTPNNALGFGLYTGATVGNDVNPDGVEWNTSEASYLSTGQPGLFGPDTGWAGSVPAAQIIADIAVPEPGTIALLVPALIGLVARARGRSKRSRAAMHSSQREDGGSTLAS